jgi:2',3'-cyclic-nucleotide 2'-phosphodiesterase (5'-nucleotidase family)
MNYIFCLLLAVACSFKKSNQTLKGHEELYSVPEAHVRDLDKDERRIVVAATNDLHGNLSPLVVKFDDRIKQKQSVTIGGQAVMSSYFQILRDTYKNVLLVDSGDILGNASDTSSAASFLSKNHYDAVTFGLRDFNLKVPSAIGGTSDLFQRFARETSTPLLLGNLYDLKTARVVEWEGTKSHLLKEIDDLKIGVIGVIPDDVVGQTPVNNRIGFYVENMLQSTLRHARLLRSLGADIIVVITHQGIDCNSRLAEASKLPADKVNFDPALQRACDLRSPLGEYLGRLPPDLIDVVVGGRTEEKMANIVNGVLVLGGFPNGKSFSYVELVVNVNSRKINREKTVVHQPVLFCHEFFKETDDCYTGDPSVDHSKRTPARFLGKVILPPPAEKTLVKEKAERLEVQQAMALHDADLSYVHESSGETQLLVVKISGRELVELLEEDYNSGMKEFWWPSPFLLKQEELTVSIAGEELDLARTYRVLTDLESAQRHQRLVKRLSSTDVETIVNSSLRSLEDKVLTGMAASAR